MRDFLSEELGQDGYTVAGAGDGESIWSFLEHTKPDLVLLDLKLGAASGLEVLKKLRKENVTMPVILCTAYPISSQEAVAMGADDMVIKSSDLLDLKVKIKKAVYSDN